MRKTHPHKDQRRPRQPPRYRTPDGTQTVLVRHPVLRTIEQACRTAWPNETGGILIGFYTADGKEAHVLRAVPAPPDSRRARSAFRRGTGGLRRLLLQLWPRGLHYVGEWHYHPKTRAGASGQDHVEMSRIALTPDYQCPQPILLVATATPESSLTLIAYLTHATMTRLVPTQVRSEQLQKHAPVEARQ